MKNVKYLIIALIMLLIGTSCSSSTIPTRELLIPDGKTMEKKLPYLENLNRSSNGTNDIAEHSGLYTIWERELLKNILDMDSEKSGSIEIVEIYREEKPNFMKSKNYLDLEFEIRIYDENERMAWNKAYYRQATYSLPFFPPKASPENRANAEIRILKSIIEEFKDDISLEYANIISALSH